MTQQNSMLRVVYFSGKSVQKYCFFLFFPLIRSENFVNYSSGCCYVTRDPQLLRQMFMKKSRQF